MNEDYELYTVEEVAKILKVTEGTLRNYLFSGKLKSVKILGNVRIERAELDRLVEEGKIKK